MSVGIAFEIGLEIRRVCTVLHGRPEGQLHCHVGGLAGRRRSGYGLGFDGRRLFGGAADVDDEFLPARVAAVAVPADQVGRLDQFEHDRAFGVLDHHGHEHRRPLAKCRLGAHPFRLHRNRRPEHDDDIGVAQHAFGDFVIGLPGAQHLVPPDRKAFRRQRLGKHLRLRPVGPAIGKEDVGHGVSPGALRSVARASGEGLHTNPALQKGAARSGKPYQLRRG